MFISNAKSTFSFVSMLTDFFRSKSTLLLRNVTARFLDNGDTGFVVVNCFCSLDTRRFGDDDADFDDFSAFLTGVSFTLLLGVNGTFDISLIPSFLLRFCALSRNF